MGKKPGFRSVRDSTAENDVLEEFRQDVETLAEDLIKDPDAKRRFLVDVVAAVLRDTGDLGVDVMDMARTRRIVKEVVKELKELDDAAITEAARTVVGEYAVKDEAIRYLKTATVREHIRDEVQTEIRALVRDAVKDAVGRVREEWSRLVADHVAAGLTKRDLTKVFNEYFAAARGRSYGGWRGGWR